MTSKSPELPTLFPVFYDCEASSLDGYPIEIGWAHVPPSLTIESEAHLINHFSWNLAGRWSKRAQRIHRISLEEVQTHGLTPYQVAGRMNAALAGRQLFADSVYDEAWLNQLFEAAGLDPAFTVRRLLSDLLVAQLAASKGISPDTFAALLADVRIACPRTHRAEQDARHLAAQWLAVLKYSQGDAR